MDDSEKVANEYLLNLALAAVVYEPDGNTPPDFLVNGTIAVEVRRLNQNEIIESGYRGLEVTRIPLEARVRKLLASLGPAQSGVSWFVCYDFGRPLPDWKELRSALGEYLLTFRANPSTEREVSATICKGFEIELRRAGNSHPQFFVPGGSADDDSGGAGCFKRRRRTCASASRRRRGRSRPIARNILSGGWFSLIESDTASKPVMNSCFASTLSSSTAGTRSCWCTRSIHVPFSSFPLAAIKNNK